MLRSIMLVLLIQLPVLAEADSIKPGTRWILQNLSCVSPNSKEQYEISKFSTSPSSDNRLFGVWKRNDIIKAGYSLPHETIKNCRAFLIGNLKEEGGKIFVNDVKSQIKGENCSAKPISENSIGQAVADLLLIGEVGEPEDFENLVRYLPL